MLSGRISSTIWRIDVITETTGAEIWRLKSKVDAWVTSRHWRHLGVSMYLKEKIPIKTVLQTRWAVHSIVIQTG